MANKKIVCLGGGIGTVNLLKGLKDRAQDISVVVSTADDGGSSGRLRRLYNIVPPGDLVSCLSAFAPSEEIANLLTYRFPGDRYGKDEELAGQKLGSLILVALRDNNGDVEKSIQQIQEIFNIPGNFYPATDIPLDITATTIEGKKVEREENIDLGKYSGEKILESVEINPKDQKATPSCLQAIDQADVIIAGPGDLYTTTLPVLIIPDIKKRLLESSAKKIFIINVANKPFETKGYNVSDFIKAIERHLGQFPFDKVIVNNNHSVSIPEKYHYEYVDFEDSDDKILLQDLVDENFPIYHDSQKLAKTVLTAI